jgi:hypothetical protein
LTSLTDLGPIKGVFAIISVDFTEKEFRRLLDMVYIGNWILNSTRGDDRITDYDEVESFLFSKCLQNGMPQLTEIVNGSTVPSKEFSEGGIHEAIMDYEDTVFFEILAEELARRDMELDGEDDDPDRLNQRIGDYINEFEMHGTDNITIDM